MKIAINYLFVILSILLFAFLISGCNYCKCDETGGISGFYICDRTNDNNAEYIWIFGDNTYVHMFDYDTIRYINSDTWSIRRDHIELFIANNWVAPCEYGRDACYKRMEYVNSNNYNEYLGSMAQLSYGCLVGLDDSCYFRLISQFNPMFNYKKIHNSEYRDYSLFMDAFFFSKRDSVMFSEINETLVIPLTSAGAASGSSPNPRSGVRGSR